MINKSFTSTLGAILILSGIVGAGVLSFYIEKTMQYKNVLVICGLAGMAAAVGLYFSLINNSDIMINVAIGIFGFFCMPVLPLGFEFAAELTFPIGETFSSGVLFTGG